MNRSNEVQRRLGVILSLVYTLVGIAAGFLFTPICTAKLGQSEYGVYTLAFSMVSYLGVFDLGFGSALIRYSARLRAQGEDPRNLYGLFLRVYLIIGAVVLALGLHHSQQAMQAQRAVTDMTNELLKKNAETLKTGTVETAKESERGIVDLETLVATNQSLIDTITEVSRIQQEGHQKRMEAEKTLANMESALKQKLLSM